MTRTRTVERIALALAFFGWAGVKPSPSTVTHRLAIDEICG